MAANKPGKATILAAFFDDGAYSPLFTDGAVSAAYGNANGQSVYVVFEDGTPVGVQDIEKNIRVLEMAAETGAPVVPFYDSTGAKLEGGLDLLNATARLTAEIARVSGVVPQIAVVTGTCAGTNAINAASADLCIMAEDAELFLNAPFNAEDKVAGAGSAEFAAKAGVAAVTAAAAVAAAKQAASIAALLPANNLAGPALFDFSAPSAALNTAKYTAADAVAALTDEGSAVELYKGYGKNIVTALATINGSSVGIVATEKAALCHKCTAKAARFVRLCDAYSIPVVTVVNTEGFGKSEGDDQAGGIRQAARMVFTLRPPRSRSLFWPVRLSAPLTRCSLLLLTGALPCRAALLHRWPPRLLSPFCTRTRSSLLITSLPLRRQRLLLTPRTSAVPRPLLPTVPLILSPMLLLPAALLPRPWICWPASALSAWLRSMATSRCNLRLT